MRDRITALLLTFLLLIVSVVPADAAESQKVPEEFTILFTHDLHSHFLPQSTEDGGETGGYARLKTAIDREKAVHPDALLLDGGDFSIGSLIQTLYTAQAAELRTMGAMGYDVVTFGNHEFDHTGLGFAQMLNAAVAARDAALDLTLSAQFRPDREAAYREQYGPMTLWLPQLVCANYQPASENPNQAEILTAMAEYGVQESTILERNGIVYGIFGLMGNDADECAPTSGFSREMAESAAQRCVESLKAQGAEVIICLSHSGTGETLEISEDEVLAETVDGIDVIVSGHTHSLLEAPIVVNDTYIVSAGPYCSNLGSLTLQRNDDGKLAVKDYHLIPIDETLEEDPDIADMVETWKEMVEKTYLDRYGLRYDRVLTSTSFDLNTQESGVQSGNALGELVADSFLWATRDLEADAPDVKTVSVTASGVLRAPLREGNLTASDAFNVLSMGVGADGTSGFPLVAVYLTGEELKAAAEVDASVTPIMPAAQLYIGGMQYTFNTHRMFFDRVTEARLCETPFEHDFADSKCTEIEDQQLYRIVTGMYSAQMLGTVKEKSMGLLSLEPKMADGSPVTDFNDCILRDAEGNEIKEWYALAAYLESFGQDGIPDWYTDSDGRKEVSHSWNPAQTLRNLNGIAKIVIAGAFLLVILIVMLVRTILRRREKIRKKV